MMTLVHTLYILVLVLIPGTVSSLELGTQNCHSADDFAGHGDVRTDDIISGSQHCMHYFGVMFAGVSPIFWITHIDGTYYHFSVSWIDGCKGSPQDFVTPLGGAICADLLYNNWKNCKSHDNSSHPITKC